ncbi:MAG: CRTAC1 family protein [Terriglobia bacterium]
MKALAAILTLCGIALVWGRHGQELAFTNIAAQAGIHAEMRCGGPQKHWIPSANGSGVAWLDYDNDGKMDLLIVNGGTMDQLRTILAGKTPAPVKGNVYLFHNLGNGKFQDVTAKAGLSDPYWGTGANAADYNNDGYTDVLITNIGLDLLYRNNGNGTFSNVSKAAGLSRTIAWHTGSAFGDFDGDGRLDLFVTGYINLHSLHLNGPAPVCNYLNQHVFCGPIGFPGGTSILYHNNGNSTFTDVTKKSGIGAAPPAHGFTAVTGDFNGDGKLDIFVANDSGPNHLFINQGHGTFKEEALMDGVAYNADGRVQSNMGVAVGHYGGSAPLDLLTTVFDRDYFPLFRETTPGIYQEVSSSTGLAAATYKYFGWACGLTDFANSGTEDFWSANGQVYPTDPDYVEPLTIFRRTKTGTALAYSYPAKPNASYRGGAVGDFNNDGKMDLVVVPVAGAPVLLRNDTVNTGHWIGLRLAGTRSNRGGIGAKVMIEACGREQTRELRNGGSYISRNDPRIHFGLGDCGKISRLTIRWPSGTLQQVNGARIDAYQTVREPE